MTTFQKVTPVVISLIVAGSAIAQAPKETEATPVHKTVHHDGPLVVKWTLKKLKGFANLEVYEDGSYVFSGEAEDKKPDHDFEISMALKNRQGGIIVFHWAGSLSNGAQWSNQGQSKILKDGFASFAGDVSWNGEWRTYESKEGIAKRYEEKKKKLAAMKKEEREKEEKAEAAQAQRNAEAAQQSAQQSSGGSSLGSTISGIASTVGSVVSTISGIGTAIEALF